MFWLASCEFRGRRVLLVENDCCLAKAVSSSISADGGIIVGISSSVEGALQVASSIVVDVVFFHVRFATHNVPLAQLFKPLGSDVVFRTGFDEWFDADEEDTCPVARFSGATRLLT